MCIGNQQSKVPDSAFSSHIVMKCVRVCSRMRLHLSSVCVHMHMHLSSVCTRMHMHLSKFIRAL